MRGICESVGGPEYHRRIVEADESPRELWDALADKGYLGVNLPERYGGGGLGMHALQAVGEEISAAGCSLLLIVVSPAIVGSILTRHGTEAQRERLAARDRRRHHPSRVRDHRARRRHQLAQPLDRRHPRRRRLPPARDEDVHLRRRGRAGDPGDRPQARGGRVARPAAADAGGHRLARAGEAVHPGLGQGLGQAVDPVLRRRRGARRPGRRRVRDRGAQGRVRRAQPGADHGRRGRERRRPPGARGSPRTTRTSARSGTTRRSAPTRASRTLSRRRRSSSSWRA